MARGRDYEYQHIDRAREAQDDWYLQRRREIQEEDSAIQTKVEVSQPGDAHEIEADSIARSVTSGRKIQTPISSANKSQIIQRKKGPPYTEEAVQFVTQLIVDNHPEVAQAIMVVQNIDRATLDKFTKAGGEFRPDIEFHEMKNSGETPNTKNKKARKIIRLNSSYTFEDTVSTYLHELNHYIDIWMAAKSGTKYGLSQERDEYKKGMIRPGLMTASEQESALGENLMAANARMIANMKEGDKPTDDKRFRRLKNDYQKWHRRKGQGKPVDPEDFFTEEKRIWLDKEAMSVYKDWEGMKLVDPENHVFQSYSVEMGYVFQKQLYTSMNPTVPPDQWAVNFKPWFKQQYAQELMMPKMFRLMTLGLKSESEGGNSPADTNSFQSQLSATKGSGNVLDESTRGEMESKMGVDLSGVKIHDSNTAHSLSESVNAKAFTHQQDVYFKNGNYNPQTSAGKELLAHELVHTVQQTGGIQRADETPAEQFENDNQLVKDVYAVVRAILKGNEIELGILKTPSVRAGAIILIEQGTYLKQDQPHRRVVAYYFIRNYAPKPEDRVRIMERHRTDKMSEFTVQGEMDFLPVELLKAENTGFNKIPDEQRAIQMKEEISSLTSSKLARELLITLAIRRETWEQPELSALFFGILNITGQLKEKEVQQVIDTQKDAPPKIQAIIAERNNMRGMVMLPYIIQLLNNNYTWDEPELLFGTILLAKSIGVENNPSVREAIDAREEISDGAEMVLEHFNYEQSQFNLFPKLLHLLNDPATWQDANLLDITISMVLQMNMDHDPAILETIYRHQNDSPIAQPVLQKHGFIGTMFVKKDVMKESLTEGGYGKVGWKYSIGRRKKYGKGRFGMILEFLGAKKKATVRDLNVDALQDQMGGTVYGMQFIGPEEFRQSSMAAGWMNDGNQKVTDDYVNVAGRIQKLTHDRKNNVMTLEAKFLPFAAMNEVWPDASMRVGESYVKDVVLTYKWEEVLEPAKNTDGKRQKKKDKRYTTRCTIDLSIGSLRMSNMQYVSTGEVYGIGDIEADTIKAYMIHKQGDQKTADNIKDGMSTMQDALSNLSYALMYTVMGNINKFMPDVQPEANAELAKAIGNYKSIEEWKISSAKTKIKNVVSSSYGLLVKEASTDAFAFSLKPGQEAGKYAYNLELQKVNVHIGKDTDRLISEGITGMLGGGSDVDVSGFSPNANRVTIRGIVGDKGVDTLDLKLAGLQFNAINALPLDVHAGGITLSAGYAGMSNVAGDFSIKLDYRKQKDGDSITKAIQEVRIDNMVIKSTTLRDMYLSFANSVAVVSGASDKIEMGELRLTNFLISRNADGNLGLVSAKGNLEHFTQQGDIALALPGILGTRLNNITGQDLGFTIADSQLTQLKAGYIGAGAYDVSAGNFFAKNGGRIGATNVIANRSGNVTSIRTDNLHNMPLELFGMNSMFKGQFGSGDLSHLKMTFEGKNLTQLNAGSVHYQGKVELDPRVLPGKAKLDPVEFSIDSKDLQVRLTNGNYRIQNLFFSVIKTPYCRFKGVEGMDATILSMMVNVTILGEKGSFAGVQIDNIHIDKVSAKGLKKGTQLNVLDNKTSSVEDISISGFRISKVDGKWKLGVTSKEDNEGKEIGAGKVTTGKIDVPEFATSLLPHLLADFSFTAEGGSFTQDAEGNRTFAITKPNLKMLEAEGKSGIGIWSVVPYLSQLGVLKADSLSVTVKKDKSVSGELVNPVLSNLKLRTAPDEILEVEALMQGKFKFYETATAQFGLYNEETGEIGNQKLFGVFKTAAKEKAFVLESEGAVRITHLKYVGSPELHQDEDLQKISGVDPTTLPAAASVTATTRDEHLKEQHKLYQVGSNQQPNHFSALDNATGSLSLQLFNQQKISVQVAQGDLLLPDTLFTSLGGIMKSYIAGKKDAEVIPPRMRAFIKTMYSASYGSQWLYKFALGYGWLFDIMEAIADDKAMTKISELAETYCANNLEITDSGPVIAGTPKVVTLFGWAFNDDGTGPDYKRAPYVHHPLVENVQSWFLHDQGYYQFRLSRLLNYQYLYAKDQPDKVNDIEEYKRVLAKYNTKLDGPAQFDEKVMAELSKMISTFEYEDFVALIGGWSGNFFSELLSKNLKFDMDLKDLKLTGETAKLVTQQMNSNGLQGSVGVSDVKEWRETKGSLKMNESTMSKFSLGTTVLPAFAYLNQQKDMKVNVGPITIGEGTFIPSKWDMKTHRNQEIESNNISLAGLKFEFRKKKQ